VVLADDPAAFAAEVVAMLADRAHAGRIARAGAARVRAEFSWRGVAEQFSERCAALVRRPVAPPADLPAVHAQIPVRAIS
jgi:glycosyltransferase involved in cell wall biosynthesis